MLDRLGVEVRTVSESDFVDLGVILIWELITDFSSDDAISYYC